MKFYRFVFSLLIWNSCSSHFSQTIRQLLPRLWHDVKKSIALLPGDIELAEETELIWAWHKLWWVFFCFRRKLKVLCTLCMFESIFQTLLNFADKSALNPSRFKSKNHVFEYIAVDDLHYYRRRKACDCSKSAVSFHFIFHPLSNYQLIKENSFQICTPVPSRWMVKGHRSSHLSRHPFKLNTIRTFTRKLTKESWILHDVHPTLSWIPVSIYEEEY